MKGEMKNNSNERVKRTPYLPLYILFIIGTLFTNCAEDTVEPELYGVITGIVLDKDTEQALSNVQISTNPNSEETLSSSTGKFILHNIPQGNITVQGIKEGYLLSFEATTVSAGDTSNVVLEMVLEEEANKPPLAPKLLYPLNQSMDVSLQTEIRWNKAKNSEADDELRYELLYFEEGSDDPLIVKNLADTSYVLSGLDFETRYYWQVSATDGVNDEKATSALFNFKTLPYPQNRIVFARKEGANFVLYSTDENASAENTVQLTNSSQNAWRPKRNPITNQITFLQNVGAELHLFTMDNTGREQHQISQIPLGGFRVADIDFSFANNFAQIIYPSYDRIYSINQDGSASHLIYTAPNGRIVNKVAVNDEQQYVAVLTSNTDGYNVRLFLIDFNGQEIETIIENSSGAFGGLDTSFNGQYILYTHDVSGNENSYYRQLDSDIFLYNRLNGAHINLSEGKANGYNDLDPVFAPNDAVVLFTYTSNDGLSSQSIYSTTLPDDDGNVERIELIEDGQMVDWQ